MTEPMAPGDRAAFFTSLGLVYDDKPREVALNEGVVLMMRPPTSIDWGIVRSSSARFLEAQDILKSAARKYGWTADDLTDLARDHEVWAVAADHMLLSELAVRIVSEVRGPGGSVEPVLGHFCELFRRDGNLSLFKAAALKAGEDLIRAKKE